MALDSPYTYRVVLKLQKLSNIPGDVVQWTFHYSRATNPTSTDFDLIATKLTSFINTAPTGASNALGIYLSSTIANTGHTVSFYQIPASPGPVGPPVYVKTLGSLSVATASTVLPDEVAVVVTYRGLMTGIAEHGAGGTRPAARRRGRLYVGPLMQNAVIATSITNEPAVGAGITDTLLKGSKQYLANELFTGGWTHLIFSRVDWATHAVLSASVDNAFDTQRRRGNLATARTVLTY